MIWRDMSERFVEDLALYLRKMMKHKSIAVISFYAISVLLKKL